MHALVGAKLVVADEIGVRRVKVRDCNSAPLLVDVVAHFLMMVIEDVGVEMQVIVNKGLAVNRDEVVAR
eukprot:5582268-Amphidinium_carterae.1